MDFNEVAIFIKVIQKGSFTGAGRALGMPKSTVSTKVSQLEKRLGVTLITRSTRKIRLTPAGEAFFCVQPKPLPKLMRLPLQCDRKSLSHKGVLK
ncbi:MAG: LysR family transcriptional regulator [Bdellovibrionota bacterium]